ncbi:MAG: TrgA family protein [Rhodobacteraceae bacterium]|nr:TrgA family protein [Paracoccaceae bacterium]
MPTAAKLIAGLALALTAAVAACVFIQEHPEMPIGLRFVLGNAFVGFFAGWYALGRSPGYSNMTGAMSGLRSLVMLLIGAGIVFGGRFVFSNLGQFRSRDPVEIPLLWIETTFEYVVLALTPSVGITLLIGGLLSGIATYQASRHWR